MEGHLRQQPAELTGALTADNCSGSSSVLSVEAVAAAAAATADPGWTGLPECVGAVSRMWRSTGTGSSAL